MKPWEDIPSDFVPEDNRCIVNSCGAAMQIIADARGSLSDGESTKTFWCPCCGSIYEHWRDGGFEVWRLMIPDTVVIKR